MSLIEVMMEQNIFVDGFAGLSDVINQFQIDASELLGCVVIWAEYNIGDYEGDAFVLFIRDGKLYEVNGSHCSCYGLEEQWSPEVTFYEALIKRRAVPEAVLDQLKGFSMTSSNSSSLEV